MFLNHSGGQGLFFEIGPDSVSSEHASWVVLWLSHTCFCSPRPGHCRQCHFVHVVLSVLLVLSDGCAVETSLIGIVSRSQFHMAAAERSLCCTPWEHLEGMFVHLNAHSVLLWDPLVAGDTCFPAVERIARFSEGDC